MVSAKQKQDDENDIITLEDAVKKLQEITKKQAEIENALKQKEAELQETKQRLKETSEAQEGWLVMTPNAAFDGETFGVKFESGMAFIPKKAVFEQVRPVFEKKKGMTDEQAEAEKRRIANVNTAELMANRLRDDFGYSIQFFGVEDLERLNEIRKQRAVERASAEEILRAQKEAMVRDMPAHLAKQFMGG